MLINTKAKVGVFSIALGAYLPQFPQLVPEFESQYADFKKVFPDTVEIIDGGMVTTKEKAQEAGNLFRAADVDIVFLQMLTYATSYNYLPAVRDLDVPVVVVNLQKVKALDYDTADIPTWLGIGYACGATGEVIADLERWWNLHQGLSVAKRMQAPPVLAVSRRAYGFDLREAQLGPHYSARYLALKAQAADGR